MDVLPQSPVEPAVVEAKEAWQKPEITAVTPVLMSEGNGGAGTDFASEAS
ncbi:hypothetical protein PY365_22955 [Roseiarcaceae bacterium H3SJ34-1]|nr:hypothetical protein [Roseiarcaceae bacterium H3SJ34-1]